MAHEKRKINAYKREKVRNPDHAHILSGILKCPCCGKGLYGNTSKAHSKDNKNRYYSYCKNTVNATGHKCTFRTNIEQTEMNLMVAAVVSAMVNNPQFAEAIKEKIGTSVDIEGMEKQLAALQKQLRQTLGVKTRLERQMSSASEVEQKEFMRAFIDMIELYSEKRKDGSWIKNIVFNFPVPVNGKDVK